MYKNKNGVKVQHVNRHGKSFRLWPRSRIIWIFLWLEIYSKKWIIHKRAFQFCKIFHPKIGRRSCLNFSHVLHCGHRLPQYTDIWLQLIKTNVLHVNKDCSTLRCAFTTLLLLGTLGVSLRFWSGDLIDFLIVSCDWTIWGHAWGYNRGALVLVSKGMAPLSHFLSMSLISPW